MHPRALRAVAALMAGLVLPLAAAGVADAGAAAPRGAAPREERSAERAGEPGEHPAAAHPTLRLAAVSGVRPDSTTLLGGGVLNDTDAAARVTLELRDLPDGMSITDVRPSPSAPQDDMAWACDATTCRLVDAAGSPRALAADEGVEVLLALRTGSAGPGDHVGAGLGGGPVSDVALDRADGAPALPAEAIGLTAAGHRTTSPGAPVDLVLTATDLGGAPIDDGTLVVTPTAPAIGDLVLAAQGPGWDCAADASSCRYTGPLGPLDSAPPLVVTATSTTPGPAAAADGSTDARTLASGAWTARATATASGQPVEATTSSPLTLQASVARDVTVQAVAQERTVTAPATVHVSIRVTPTGQGDLGAPVVVTADPPSGLELDWDAAIAPGWSCSTRAAGCRSTSPLASATVSELLVPMQVPTGAATGVQRMTVQAELEGAASAPDVAAASRAATEAAHTGQTSFVVAPPPVPELQVRLAAASTDAPASAERAWADAANGGALEFDAGADRHVEAVVRNVGSRAAVADSVLSVELTPDAPQEVRSAGGGGWDCRAGSSSVPHADPEVTGATRGDVHANPRRPLTCTTRLTEDLGPGADLALPVVLSAVDPGEVRWTARALVRSTPGHDDPAPPGAATTYTLHTGDVGAQLVPDVRVLRDLSVGGVGEVRIDVSNHGARTADGGTVVIDVPRGVEVERIDGAGWTCADTALDDAQGALACITEAPILAGTAAGAITLELGAHTRARSASLWVWAGAAGQLHPDDSHAGTTVPLDIRAELTAGAGRDLSVVTPTTNAAGQVGPAIVQLHGRSSSPDAVVGWRQLCTDAAALVRGCDGTSPAVTWLGVPDGALPDHVVARFVAPDIGERPTTLLFEFTATRGGVEHHDLVRVHLVPPSTVAVPGATPAGAAADSAPDAPGPTSSTDETGGSSSGGRASSTTVEPATSTTPPESLSVSVTPSAVLQVATRTAATLVGVASSTRGESLSYTWAQTAGPDATLDPSTIDSPSLSFTAPSLEPDQTSAALTFELTVEDTSGHRAAATASVEVVWGDDGLQVEVAGGEDDLVATVDSPLSIASTVTSAGAPYQYDWHVTSGPDDLLDGVSTTGATLDLAGPAEPTEATVELTVTDSFGRVTSASVDLSITELHLVTAPAAFCAALSALAAGRPATLAAATGPTSATLTTGVVQGAVPTSPTTTSSTTTTSSPSVTTAPTTSTSTTSTSGSGGAGGSSTTTTRPSTTTTRPTTSTTTPPSCAMSATATISDGTVVLPGGFLATAVQGTLGVAGLSVTSATIAAPANWGVAPLSVGPAGLMLPFVSSTAIGSPLGSIGGSGLPLTALTGWSGTTTVGFGDAADGAVSVQCAGAPVAAGTTRPAPAIQLSGTLSADGAADLDLTAQGVATVGPVDVPLAGTIRTSGATDPPIAAVDGTVPTATALSAAATIAQVHLVWALPVTLAPVPEGPSSGGLLGTATVTLGTGPAALPLQVAVSLAPMGTPTFAVTGTSSPWTPFGSDGPALGPTGTMSLDANHFSLDVRSAPTGAWSAAHALGLDAAEAVATVDCALPATSGCLPVVSLTATADTSPLGVASFPVSGGMDPATGRLAVGGASGALGIGPVALEQGRLELSLDPSGELSAVASGTAGVQGASRAATVQFGADAAVLSVDLGTLDLAPGWSLTDGVVLVADVDTVTGAEVDGDTVALTAGVPAGIGQLQLPSTVTSGALPASVTSGRATFTPAIAGTGPTSPSQVRMVPEAPSDWFVAGAAGGQVAVQVTGIGFDVAVTGAGTAGATVTVDVDATAEMAIQALAAGGSDLPLTFAGRLGAAGGTGGTGGTAGTATLFGTFSAAPGVVWTSVAGVQGLDLSSIELQWSVSGPERSLGFTARTSLPTAFTAPLDIPAAAQPTTSADLLADDLCLATDFSSGGAGGIDIGATGLIAGAATLVLAPQGCSTTVGPTDPGLTLQVSGDVLGDVDLAVDPTTLTLTDTLTSESLSLGGVTLTDATTTVGAGGAAWSIEVEGTATIGDASLSLGGTLSSATGPSDSTIVLSGQVDELVVHDQLTLSDAQVSLTAPALIDRGTPSIGVTGGLDVLGATVPVALVGSVQSGVISTLHGGAGMTTFALPDTDRLEMPVSVAYHAASADPVTIGSTVATATLTTPTRTFSDGTVELGAAGELGLTASAALAGALAPTAIVTGSYDSSDGTYELTTPAPADVVLSGFTAPATASFERTGGKEAAEQAAVLDLGVFDSADPLTVSGALLSDGTATLSGTVADVEFRGLGGSFTMTLTPGEDGWYDGAATMVTESGDCDLWASAPTLTGTVYRTDGVSSYTLAGDVTMVLPLGFAAAPVPGQADQPMVLSNETYYEQSQQGDSDGITLTEGINGPTFLFSVTAALYPTSCGYSIGGTAQLAFGAGPTGDSMESTMPSPNTVSTNVDDLFGPNGSPPESLLLARQDAQMHALVTLRRQQAAAAAATAQSRQEAVAEARAAVDDASDRLSGANASLATASAKLAEVQQQLNDAQAQLEAAQARVDELDQAGVQNPDEQEELPFAQERQADAEQQLQQVLSDKAQAASALADATTSVATAQQSVDAGQTAVSTRTTQSDEAGAELNSALDDLQTATTAAANADQAAADAKSNANSAHTATTFQLTVDWTHCPTCATEDTLTIDGQLYFAVIWVAGIDVEVDITDGAFSSASLSLTVGIDKQFAAGLGPVGIYASASLTGTLSGGYSTTGGWTVDFTLAGQAQLDAYLDLYVTTLSATLASVDLSLTAQFVPLPVAFSGSAYVDVLGYGGTFAFGPDSI